METNTQTPALQVKNPRRYVPGDDPLPELFKHFTAQQAFEIAQAVEFIKDQTGHGEVRITIKAGLPRFISVEYSQELKP